MHPNVYSSTIYNIHAIETWQVSINRLKKKLYINTHGMLIIEKSKIFPFSAVSINIENITLSKTEKGKHYIY